jgi:methionyl-tRNA formyltransferase
MKLIFAGTPQNAAQSLEIIAKSHEVLLVITRPDAPLGRKRLLTPSPVAQMAERLGIAVIKTSKFTSEVIQTLSETRAEIAVVVAFGCIVPEAARKILPWWNLHFSLLPKWRGATPLQHSILHGGDGSGVTVFEIESGLDTGPILASAPVAILEDEATVDALPRFTAIGTDLLLKTLDSLPTAIAQVGDFSLAPKFDREMAKIDWSKDATVLSRQVSALNPEPMSWCLFGDQPLRILRARAVIVDGKNGKPGSIQGPDEILVSCGQDTWLQILEVQPAGKKPMPASDWYRGINKEVTLG